MKDRKKYQYLPKQHICQNCNTKFIAPMHCGHPMHIVEHIMETDEKMEWSCWMGTNCGSIPFEAKCDTPSLVPE